MVILNEEVKSQVQPVDYLLLNSGTHYCNIQPKIITEAVDEDGFLDSDDDGAPFLIRRSVDFTSATPLTTRSAITNCKPETTILDGVHVTAL